MKQAVSAGWSLDGSLKSADNPVAVLSSVDDAQFTRDTVWQDPQLMVSALSGLTQRTAASPARTTGCVPIRCT